MLRTKHIRIGGQYPLERDDDESLEGDIGVRVGDNVEKVAVPKRGDLGPTDDGPVVKLDMSKHTLKGVTEIVE